MESKGKLSSTNSKKEPLTVERLKSFKGLEDITDQEAVEIVFALQTLANILHDIASDNSENNPIKKAA